MKLKLDKLEKDMLEFINNNVGLFYDANLLPEQFKHRSPEWWFVIGFAWGVKSSKIIEKLALKGNQN